VVGTPLSLVYQWCPNLEVVDLIYDLIYRAPRAVKSGKTGELL
jgi:hypothetical protein